MRCVFLFLLLITAFIPVAAQQYNFRNWTLEQGLPQSQINDIIQDHQGHLWLATKGGLSKFNGKEFYTYTKENGLHSNNTTALLQDSRKRIWIGSSDRGIAMHTGASIVLFPNFPAMQITYLAEDRMGKVWLATEKGLFYYTDGNFVKYQKLPQMHYTALALQENGSLWAGTKSNGLFLVKGDTISNFNTGNSSLQSNSITALAEGKEGLILIGTEAGASKMVEGELKNIGLPLPDAKQAVASFLYDEADNLWIAFEQNGIIKLNNNGFEHLTRHNGLRTKRVNTLAKDSEGNIWIGTNGYGLQQYTSPWFIHYFEFGELSEPRVTTLTHDPRGRIWLGTDEGYTAFMSGGHLNWNKQPPWPEGTSINHIRMLDNEEWWVSTSNGLWHIRPNEIKKYTTANGLSANEALYCHIDKSGKIWVATANGLSCITADGVKNYKVSHEPDGGKVYYIHQDQKEQLWFGTSAGIFLFENGNLVKHPAFRRFKIEEVTSIAEDKLGNLYFGAYNYGILVLNKKWKDPILFSTANGLPNEGIKGLFIDNQDNLWAGTNRDVLKISLPLLRQNKELNFRSYAGSNGFKGIEICLNAITQTPNGQIWFGTTKGLTQYLPKLDRRNKVYPKMSLQNVMLFQKPTNWEELGQPTDTISGLPVNLQLNHTQNHLTFEFQGVCLSGPDKVKYRFRLKGHEKQWSPATDQTFASYASLNPGTYTFELKAQNNDGYWTPKPLTYTFSIVPPIWRREWFIGVLLLLLAGAILGIVRLRERSLLKMNTLLEMRVNHRTRLLERKNREKEMLLQEIHHRVKNNLQIVISMLNLQARHVEDPKAVEVMRAIRSRVRSMAILHERLYLHDDLGQIDLDDYFRAICESLYEAYGVTGEQVKLQLQVPRVKVDIDSAITLGLIVNELASNSLKYAFPGGDERLGILRIKLELEENNRFILTVSDNGKGLPPDFDQKKKQSFGLQLVSSLSKKLNGTITFLNDNGTKSILYFVLPT